MENVFLGLFYFGALFTVVTAVMGAISGHGPGGEAGHALPGDTGPLTLKGVDMPVLKGADMPVLKGADMPVLKGLSAHDVELPAGEGPVMKALHPVLSFINTTTIVAFLTWFGGAGYVATHFGQWPWFLAVIPAVVAGTAGGGLVAAFIHWLRRGSTVMRASDFRLEGTLARVTVEIPANGVGEIVFTMAGTTRSEAAKNLTNRALPQGAEVVITGYARGMATVEPLKELLDGSTVGERAGEASVSRVSEEE